jgi:Uma2 family endonuclease
MVTAEDLPPMTEAEYLAFADEQEYKYEYANGQVIAMAGASDNHKTIAVNITTTLNIQMRETNCRVHASDARVYIDSKATYRHPDATVYCGDPVYAQGRTDTITNPVMLVEVMSPGTEYIDRGQKLTEYTQMESLQAYVLIAQDEPRVEIFRRQTVNKWQYEHVSGLDAELAVQVQGYEIRLSLAELYLKVRWEDEAD